jgi:hypothetical protein
MIIYVLPFRDFVFINNVYATKRDNFKVIFLAAHSFLRL